MMNSITTRTKIQIQTSVRKYLADLITPVSLYLKLRDHFTEPVLLESNDFRSKADCSSYLGLDALASFEVKNGQIIQQMPDGRRLTSSVEHIQSVPEAMNAFLQSFEVNYQSPYSGFNGCFGHTNFDAVQYFDSLTFPTEKRKTDLPDIRYTFYRFVLSINHFKDEIEVLENLPAGYPSRLSELEELLQS
ncbi:MAG: anthranilate synthase component I family protein, partial [Bacteroidota bacterium]